MKKVGRRMLSMAAVTLERETTDETTLESLKESLLKLDKTSLQEVSQVVNSFLVVQKVKSGLEKVG
jgi:hypothetical protein